MKPRKYPYAEIGDYFGTRKVVALVPRKADSNERVEVCCDECGARAVGYVYNFRKAECPCQSRPGRKDKVPRLQILLTMEEAMALRAALRQVCLKEGYFDAAPLENFEQELAIAMNANRARVA